MSKPINFTDTTVIKKPYVKIGDIEYEVQDGIYQGGTDLNANTFNTMQDELNLFRNIFSTFLYQMNTDYRQTLDFVKVKPNTTYIFSSKDNNVNFEGNLMFYNANKEQQSQVFVFKQPFTTPSDCEWIKVTFANENAPLDAKIQLEEGTEKTSYVSYIPENVKNAIPTKVSDLLNDKNYLPSYKTIIANPIEYTLDNNSMYLVIVHVNGNDMGIMDIVFKQNGTAYKTSLKTYPSNITITYTNEKITIIPQYTTAVSIIKLIG